MFQNYFVQLVVNVWSLCRRTLHQCVAGNDFTTYFLKIVCAFVRAFTERRTAALPFLLEGTGEGFLHTGKTPGGADAARRWTFKFAASSFMVS